MLKMFSFVVLVITFGLNGYIYAQKIKPVKDDDLLAVHFKNIRIKDARIEKLLSQVSFYYDIPIGLEMAFNDEPNVYDDSVDFETIPFMFNDNDPTATYFKNGELSDLLNQIVSKHDYYTWGIKDGVVNVFPKDKYRDAVLKDLLETKINSFSVNKNTSCMQLEESLMNSAEIAEKLNINSITYVSRDYSGFYIQQLGRDFTLNVSNISLKSILNKLLKESPTAQYWIINRYSSDKKSLSLAVVANVEYDLVKNKKSVSTK